MARTAKKAAAKPAAPSKPSLAKAASSPPTILERPAEPKRFKANKDQLLDFYKQMLLIRRFEERAGQLYGLGLIGGFCHLYIGQEAVAVGLQSAKSAEYAEFARSLAFSPDAPNEVASTVVEDDVPRTGVRDDDGATRHGAGRSRRRPSGSSAGRWTSGRREQARRRSPDR